MATVDRIEDVVDDERVGRRRAIAPRPWPATRAEHDEPGCHGAQILSSRSATGFPGRRRALGGLEERPGFAGALRTSGGFGGPCRGPHVFRPRSRRPPDAALRPAAVRAACPRAPPRRAVRRRAAARARTPAA